MPASSSIPLTRILSDNFVTVALGVAGLAAYFLISRGYAKSKQKAVLNYVKLHCERDNGRLTKQASDLLMDQWPHRFVDAGLEVQNFVSIDSLNSSSESLPCHLLAVKCLPGQKISDGEVVGHVVLRKGPRSGAHGKERFAKMLKVGVPIDTVRKAAQVMGVDISDMLESYESGEFSMDDFTKERTEKEREISLASLVVESSHRGQGIGKALCAYAVIVAGEMNADSVIGSCAPENVPFFLHIGCHKATGAERADIPKVKLGNELVSKINPEVLSNAMSTLERKHFID